MQEIFLSLYFERTYLFFYFFFPSLIKWKSWCKCSGIIDAVLLSAFAGQCCSSFTDYFYNVHLHIHLSFHVTGALKREAVFFLMYDENHLYAFLPKLKSTCWISFQVIHVLEMSFLPFSKRINCFCNFFLLVFLPAFPIPCPAGSFWSKVSALLPTTDWFSIVHLYIHWHFLKHCML